MMKKLLLALGFTIIFIIPGHSQYKITNYTDMNQINSLVEDGDYIWVCTSGGAFKRRKSDGSIVTVFNQTNSGIARNRVNCMYIDFYGNYWFGTNWGGISKFDGSTWTTIDNVDGFRISDCRTITEDLNGNLWFGINDGHVLKFDGENWENINLNGEWYVGTILSDDDGNVWAGIPGIHGSAYKIDPDGVVTQIYGPGNAFVGNGVYDIGKDRNGNIWFTGYDGVYRYTPLSDHWTNYNSQVGYNNYAYSQDSEGNIWIATSHGVYKYNGSTWSLFTSGESGDRADMVMDVLCDAQDHVWVGSYNGLARIVNGSNTWSAAIRINALKSNYVETMTFSSDGTARLFGQFNYMIGFSNDYWWETTPTGSCYISWIKNSVIDANDNSWISYMNGVDSIVKLIRITPKSIATCYDVSGKIDFGQYPTGFVKDMAFDRKFNIIWLATEKGLIWFNATYGSYGLWTTGMYGLPEDYITGVEVRDGVVWYGTSASGIGYYNVNTNKYGVFNIANGLPSDNISDLSLDKNGDLLFLSGNRFYHKVKSSYTSVTLPLFYNFLTVDSLNNVWFGGNGGAAKYNGQAVQTFTTDDGLNENNIDEIVVSPDNDVWLCSGYFGITKISTVAPEPDFLTPKTCLPAATHLTNTSTETDTLSRYKWDINDDGSVEYTTRDFNHQFTDAGIYKIGLTVTNDNMSRHTSKKITILESPDASISPGGTQSICYGDKMVIEGGVKNRNTSLSYSYNWNTGSRGSSIATDSSGAYYFEVSNGFCTSFSDTVTVITNEPYEGMRICMVTVDPTEKKNTVVWNPARDKGITSYNVYKLFGNTYVPIGNVPAGDPSYYVDYSSIPEAQAARYAISVIDTCGNESPKSPYHQTIHLGASIGAQENTIVLDWTPYIDESGEWQPEWYYIYRGVSPDKMEIHDSISSSFTEWNDLDPGDNRYYQISVKKDNPCMASTKKGTGGPYAHSLSNLEDNKLKAGVSQFSSHELDIYPNPFDDQTLITWDNPAHKRYRIVVTGLRGQVLRSVDGITGNEYVLEKAGLAPGMYFVTVAGDKIYKARIVVE